MNGIREDTKKDYSKNFIGVSRTPVIKGEGIPDEVSKAAINRNPASNAL